MKILLTLIAIGCTTFLFAQNSNEHVRINQLFNFGWKFKAGEVTNAQDLAFNDNDWRKLDLPHDFQFEQPWDSTANRGRGFKAMGAGWYRKTFRADATWKGRRVFIDFEGIMLHGDVWLNGKKIGDFALENDGVSTKGELNMTYLRPGVYIAKFNVDSRQVIVKIVKN